jgi:hypothetical protein
MTTGFKGSTVRLMAGRYGMHILIPSLITSLRRDQVNILKSEPHDGIKNALSNYIDEFIGRLEELEKAKK